MEQTRLIFEKPGESERIFFVDAVRELQEHGVVVLWTASVCGGRLYKVYQAGSSTPPIWMLPEAVCSYALLYRELEEIVSVIA